MCGCSVRRVPAIIRGSSGELDPEPEANVSKTVRDRGFGEAAPCSAHHALTVAFRSISDINIDDRLRSSSAADAGSQLSVTGPNPPRGFLQEQQHRTDASMSGPPGLRSFSPVRQRQSFRIPPVLQNQTGPTPRTKKNAGPKLVLKAGGVTRGRSFRPGTVTTHSDVTRSDGPKGKQRE